VQRVKPAAASAQERAERRREAVAYYGYRAIERLVNALPRSVFLPAAAAIGNLGFDLARAKRRVVRENLAHAMGAAPDDPAVVHAARRVFRNYAKYLADVMRLAEHSEQEFGSLVDVENVELLAEAREAGKGVLLCTVHIGGMDMMAPAFHRRGHRAHVIADDTTYPTLYEHLKAVRERHGVHLIGWRNLRKLVRALRHEENVVLFCDVGFRRGDVPVDFLGEATTFPAGPATLSARSGAPMLPVRALRTASDRFSVGGLPLIWARSTEPVEIQRATQELADALGSVIAADPGQWYMFRPIWPQAEADRQWVRSALAAARAGEDWTKPLLA